jgi:organic hydroperoxide reductase OsmC/OhrA
MSLEKVVYRAQAKATGGRDGQVVSSDGVLNVKLVFPKKWEVRAVPLRILNNYLLRIFSLFWQ